MGSPRAILVVAVLVACGAAFLFLRGRGDGANARPGPRGPLAVDGAPPPLAAGPRVSKDATDEVAETPAPTAAESATPEELDPADRPAWWPTSATDGHRAVRLRVHCVNAVTGETLGARWRLLEVMSETAPSVPWIDSRWRSGALVATTVPGPDGLIEQFLEIAAPDGFLSREAEVIQQPFAADVTEARITVPLWPAFDLELTLRGPGGSPAKGVRLDDFSVAGASLHKFGGEIQRPSSESDDRGVVRVDGLPFVPGAEFRARVLWRTEPTAIFGGVEFTAAELARPPVVWSLPDVVATRVVAEAHIAGPTDAAIDPEPPVPGTLAPLDDVDVVPAEAFVPPDPSTAGRLRVRVLAADGRRVARAEVSHRAVTVETDEEGFAELANLAPGRRKILVSVSGGFGWAAVVEVKAGAAVDVELREPEAGRLDVDVVDGGGRPCPLAQITVDGTSRSAMYDVEDGVQRLDNLTDAGGRRSFRRVAPGEVSVTAEWRGRRGEAKVVVEERGRVSARIVVR